MNDARDLTRLILQSWFPVELAHMNVSVLWCRQNNIAPVK